MFDALNERARARDLQAVVITFSPHPVRFFRGAAAGPFLLSSAAQKIREIERCGVDVLLTLRFDEELASMDPDEFVHRIIVEGGRARDVLIGHDFRFGKARAGNIPFMKTSGERLGFGVEVFSAVLDEGAPISSSRVRQALHSGDPIAAERWIGRPYRMEGVIVRGHARGRGLGFPTANLDAGAQLPPASGVYITTLYRDDGRGYDAITNIGSRPTFNDEGAAQSVESFLLDPALPGDLDLYGETVELEIHRRVRPERRFESPEALVQQIGADIVAARAFHSAHPRPPEAQIPSCSSGSS